MRSEEMRNNAQVCRGLAEAAGQTAAQGAYLRAALAWEKMADKGLQSEEWQREFGSAKKAPRGRPAGAPSEAQSFQRVSKVEVRETPATEK